MKKILLVVFMVGSLGFINSLKAQCTISDLKINLKSVNQATCEVIFDFSWTQEVNSGNKFAYIHIWTQSDYHTPAANWVDMYSGTSAYPKKTDLANALTTFVIDNNSLDNPAIGVVYHPDPAYILPLQAGVTITKVHLNNTLIERMTLKNIRVILPSCTQKRTLMLDVWASQAANGKNVHCVSEGGSLVINEVRPFGLLFCTFPRQYQVSIYNNGPVLDNVSFEVRLDYNPVGILDQTDTLIYNSGLISLPANETWTSGVLDYSPYNSNPTSVLRPLIVEVTVPLRPNTTITLIENSCGPLAVIFTSFTAVQLKDRIALNWQTAFEQNNRGFEVQRKLESGNYSTIAFVPTRSIDGNTNAGLNYSYDDWDNLIGSKDIFYRIKQVDFDGSSSFSEVRLIKISGVKTAVLLYPNPTREITNVVVPAASGPIDLIITDMKGAEVKRYSDIITDRFSITNLNAGVYLVKIFFVKTGQRVVKKLVVL